jgi:Flp pilus assembly pilin Flp
VTPNLLVRVRRSSAARQAGQGLVEYGLILVVAVVVCVASLLFFGDELSSLLSLIASAV